MGNGTFKRPIVGALQRAVNADFNRAGQYSSRDLQDMMLHMMSEGGLAQRNGFFSTGFQISTYGAGSWDLVAAPGWGFHYDASGLGTDESANRVLWLSSATTVSWPTPPPAAATTYYAHVKWGSNDGQSESRRTRPAAGAAFNPPAATNTAHVPEPVFLVSTNAIEVGYIQIAEIAVGAGPLTDGPTDYTITDTRPSLSQIYRYQNIPLSGGSGYTALSGWEYESIGLGAKWKNTGAVALDALEFDIPIEWGDDVPQSPIVEVSAFVDQTNAADATNMEIYKVSTAGAGTSLTGGAPATWSGIVSAWGTATVSVAHASQNERIVAVIQPTVATGTISVRGLYAKLKHRYMGP